MSQGQQHSTFSRGLGHTIVILEILLVTILSFSYLAEKSFWVDETYSYITARDWLDIWHVMLKYGANMWLYYSLLHFWLKIGDSEFIIRSLSAFFAIATVPLLYVLGTRLFNRRTGILAALILAVNAFFIHYAQEARSYSLLLFLTILASYLFARAVDRPTWKYWGGYMVSIMVATLTHFFGALVFIAHLTSLVSLRSKLRWKHLILSGLVIAIFITPFLLLQPKGTGNDTWLQPPQFNDIGQLFLEFAGIRSVLTLYFVLGFVAVVFYVTRFPQVRTPLESWRFTLLISWLLVPPIIAFVVSFFVTPVFVSRFLIICLPPLILLTAVGLSRINQQWLQIITLLLIVYFSARGVSKWYREEKENWREATTYVSTSAQPGDAVLFYPYFIRNSFEYYFDRLNPASDSLALLELASWSYSPAGGGWQPDPDEELLGRLPGEFRRVWLILSHDTIPNLGREAQRDFIQRTLSGEYTLIQERKFTGIRILRYERKTGAIEEDIY